MAAPSSQGRAAERLGLRGLLAKLPWVSVTRGDQSSAPEKDVVHSIRSTDDIAEAFGRRDRS